MCGIAGIVSTTVQRDESISLMTAALLHRGPDANNVFTSASQKVALGHTRLSIIDLSTTANQPFFSPDKRYVIVFNGEIYNFQQIRNELANLHGTQFKTHSDTEVIVEAFSIWREEMVKKLDGMFSIAIFDQHENNVYLFRDRVGKKPLFYFQSKNIIAFASELKSLLKHPIIRSSIAINKKVVSTILHLGYIPEPQTIYTNIYKFPAGHYGKIDSNLNLKIEAYWKIQDHIKKERIQSPAQAITKLHNLLTTAVKDRLISDVPVGAFLSGGTDSSLVTALAAQHVTTPLKTFSIGFKESKFDESQYARAVAKQLKTDHTEYTLPQHEALDILDTYLNHFDEPFADTSAIPTMLVSKLARQQVKVALTGDGGDELFQGYGSYRWANRLDSLPWKIGKGPLRSILSSTSNSKWLRVANLLAPVKKENIRSHIFSQEQYFFSQHEIQNELLNNQQDFIPFEYNGSIFQTNGLTSGELQALFDFEYYLKDDLLVKVDRASMYHALECRCPLLDHHLVEYAFSLNESFKIRQGRTKWILKELLREYLPDQLIDRPKWGFSVPLAQWLKGDLAYLIDQFLNEQITSELGLFNVRYIQNLIKNFKSGHDYLYNRIWILIVVQKWLKDHS